MGKHFNLFNYQSLIDNQTDQQIADSIGESDAILAIIDFTQWKQLNKLSGKCWCGELLQVVQDYGQAGLDNYLKSKGIWSVLS